jgi:hypothetical protein
MHRRLRVVVSGLIAQHPWLGGLTWHYYQYVLGLRQLGHEVYYIEDSGQWPYTLDGGVSGDEWIARDCAHNVHYLSDLMERAGLAESWAYRFPTMDIWYGLSESRRRSVLESADLLLNVSGSLECPWNYRIPGQMVYIDTDPVFTQIKLALGQQDFRARIDAHDLHFSYGENLSPTVPDTGHQWRPTRQPIVLSEWTPRPRPDGSFTTVMNWTSYTPLVYDGRVFGQKDIEFLRFLDLPALVNPTTLEVAMGGTRHREWETSEGDVSAHDLLERRGWRVVDAAAVTGDFERYRQYIYASKAEWSVAKNGYVAGQVGWFSERSACYLAAGKPVVVQDTGIAPILPVGRGILSFRTSEEAAAAIRDVDRDYDVHSRAARQVAEEYFDSHRVLTLLVNEAAGVGA